MRFTTETGSVYELDTDNKKVRRVHGEHDPLPEQGADGEWQEYELLLQRPALGQSARYAWQDETGKLRAATTSRVVELATL